MTNGGRPRGAEALARALVRAGVAVAAGVPSRADLPLVVALRAQGVRVLATATEAAAVAAADGFARRSATVGVVLGTGAGVPLGDLPGAAEAVDAEVPLLLVEPPRPGADAAPLSSRVTREVLAGPGDDLVAVVRHARDLALASPAGPVVLRLAAGVEHAAGPADADDDGTDPPRSAPAAVEHVQLRRAGNLVDAAQHVLIWAGGGALRAGAGGAVAELAEKLGAPVVLTAQAAGLLPARHPCLVGLPPHLPAVGALWDRADIVIAVGSDLDDRATQGRRMPEPDALVAINVDPVDAGRHYRPDVLLRGDAKVLTKALADATSYRGGTAVVRSRLHEIRTAARRDLAASDPHETAFLDAVAAAVPDRATVVADPCTAGAWLAAFHEWTLPRTLLVPAGDAVGYAVPAALGAAATGTTDPVLAVIGDQGLLACLGELAVVAREKLPLTVLVVDDGGAGRLRPDLVALGLPPEALDRPGPDLAATARTFGLRADAVEVVGEDLVTALRAHIAAPDPTVLVLHARLGLPPTDEHRWYRTAGAG